MPKSIKQTMSEHPVSVREKDDLSNAYMRMKREGFRHLPVINDAGNIVGMISDRDFQRAMWLSGFTDAHGLPDSPKFPDGAKVGEFMSRPVLSMPDETDLIYAIETMIEKKVSAIVITRDEKMVGIITHEDLLKVLASLLKEMEPAQLRAFSITSNSSLGTFAHLLQSTGL